MEQQLKGLWLKRARDLSPEEKTAVECRLNRWQALHYRNLRDACGEYYGDLYLDIARGLKPIPSA